MVQQRIGDINGKWSMLLKIQLLGLPVLAAVLGWMCMLMIGLSNRVSVIESNRFTAADAYQMEQRIDSRFDTLPPKWFVQRMDKLEARLDALEKGLN